MSDAKYLGAQVTEEFFKAVKTALVRDSLTMRRAIILALGSYLEIDLSIVDRCVEGGNTDGK